MTTYVLSGPSVLTNFANDPDGIAAGFNQSDDLEIVVRDHRTTFSYSPRPFEEFDVPDIFMNLDVSAVLVRAGGQTFDKRPGAVLVFNADWDDSGTTRNSTMMAISVELSEDLFLDYLFGLDGDALPAFVKAPEVSSFLQEQVDTTSIAAPSGAWAAGTDIPFSSIPGVTSSDRDFIEMEFVKGETAKGGIGNDTILGDGFDETLSGGRGDDFINAGIGDDSIIGGKGEDTLEGGFGNDTILGGAQSDSLDGQGGDDQIYGGGGGDFVNGGDGFDSLYGGKGNDTLEGGAGADFIDGGVGNDDIQGNFGFDTIWAGTGDDTVDGGVGDDEIGGGSGDDEIIAGDGNDTVFAADGADYIIAGDNNDIVYCGAGNDTTDGGDGDDQIFGFTGDDLIDGGAGNDTIYAGLGDDTVDGGGGANEVYLAGGADEFIFSSGQDTVFDFDASQGDVVNLAGLFGVDDFNDLTDNHMTNTINGVLIDNDLGSTLLLSGLVRSDLSVDEFIFV